MNLRKRLHMTLVAGAILASASMSQAQPVFVTASARTQFGEGVSRGEAGLATFLNAWEQLQQRLGDQTPKGYIISDNLGASSEIARQMQQLANGVPYTGAANNWDSYLPIDRNTLAQAPQNVHGVNITAILGDVDVQMAAISGVPHEAVNYDWPREQQDAHWQRLRPGIAERAEQLAQQLQFPEGLGQHVVIVQGTMHTPKQQFVMEGLQRALPAEAMLIGGAASDFGNVYWQGRALTNALYAVRISGNFRAVAGGSQREGRDDQAAPRLDRHLQTLRQQLGSEPTAVVYFGCAGWRRELAAQQAVLTERVPEGVGVFGQFCGGEIGRLEEPDLVADTNLGVLLLMGPGDPNVSAASMLPSRARAPQVAMSLPDDNTSPFLTERNFVTDWAVLGPFDFEAGDFGGDQQQAALDHAFMPNEDRLTPTARGPEGTNWRTVSFDQGLQAGQCNLGGLFGNEIDNAAAYAVAVLHSPRAVSDAKLYVGSDDYIRVWINGREVLTYNDQRRGSDWDQNAAENVALREGANHVVVKVVDVVGDWDFYFRMTDADDMPISFQLQSAQ